MDDTKPHTADVASDAAPRRQAPAPTEVEPSKFDPADRVAELSAITKSDVDGNTFTFSVNFFMF